MKIRKQSGFTLIELMTVVAIMGILSAIAYPSYVKSVRKGKRSDAKVELLRLAQMQESFFAQNMTYANTLTTLGLSADIIQSEQNEYDVTVGSRTPSDCDGTSTKPCIAYMLVATPRAGTTQKKDTQCPRFTFSSTGAKGAATGATASEIRACWK